MDYNKLTKEDLLKQDKYKITVVKDTAALHLRCLRILADLIKERNEKDEETLAILPVGTLEYSVFARIASEENISLEKFSVCMMDEYVGEDGKAIPEEHPCSFRRFIRQSLLNNLDPKLGFDEKRVYFPMPENCGELSDMLLSRGGADICFGGFGITGHFAFNDPPEPHTTLDPTGWARETKARMLTITRESNAQMAMGGVHGNWDLLPRMACTLGMKELCASKYVHLTFIRNWHSGVLRRALFGPVTGLCPGSLLQEHPNLEITMNETAAAPPTLDLLQDTGEKE